ncbi:MAG TPA: LytR C-terminal domain-containing protein [Solirubrobacteraceae bacterium]|nr:LytR C-terminal domain-containing protein [Solirubrobacteraceae bacterium]
MGSMPLAFSVHNFISSVGADAGFAAIIGLAVLVLLYFAHARETANLREEASVLAERLQQAEARVAELSRPAAVGAAVPVAEGVHVTDQRGGGVAGRPFAPAGVGAPALAAATHVVPLPEPAPPAQVPQPAVAAASVSAAAASASPPVAPPPPSVAPRPAASPEPVPAGAVAAAPGGGLPGPATSAGATSAGTNGGGRGGAPVMPAPRPRGAMPGGAPRRELPPLGPPAKSRGSLAGRVLIGLVSLVVVAGVVVVLVVLTSTKSTTSSAPPTQTSNAPTSHRAAAFAPSSVTVAVLNGTATNQLAHRVAAKLATSGYKEGRIATAANQTATTTIVAYLPGSKNRIAARHVATALDLKPTAVQPIDQSSQQVACPPGSPCTANVVVTVGADLNTLS